MADLTLFLDTANSILVLLTGLVGLIGSGVGAYFAIKNWITVLKTKNSDEIWKMIILDTITNLAKGDKISLAFQDSKIMKPAFKELDTITMKKYGIKHYSIYENLEEVKKLVIEGKLSMAHAKILSKLEDEEYSII